jgi:hypothetical protein
MRSRPGKTRHLQGIFFRSMGLCAGQIPLKSGFFDNGIVIALKGGSVWM